MPLNSKQANLMYFMVGDLLLLKFITYGSTVMIMFFFFLRILTELFGMYTGYHSLYVVPCSSNVVVCCVMNLYAVQYISGFINEFHGEPAIVRTGL